MTEKTNKYRKMILMTVCLSSVIAVQGNCTEQREVQSEVVFTDDLGTEITVNQPQRIAALLGSFADIWYLAGGEVIASAEDAWDDFDLPLPEDAVNLGMTKELSLEKLFEADPDLVLASTNTKQHLEWRDTLDAAGIQTAYFDVSDFEDYLRVLDVFTEITGEKDLYEKYGLEIQDEMQSIADECAGHIEKNGKAPKVLVLRSSASMIKIKNSENNVLGEMLRALGCENIADSDTSLLENLSLERVMIEDPDFIFIAQHGDDPDEIRKHMEAFMREHPAWEGLRAVQEGHVYYMEKSLYTLKPNDRWAEAYENLKEILFYE